MLLVPGDFCLAKDAGRRWDPHYLCWKRLNDGDVFWDVFHANIPWFEVERFFVTLNMLYSFGWVVTFFGKNTNYCEQNWSCPVFHERNIRSNTRISRTCFSRLPPNISILHVFVGKNPMSLWNSTPNNTPTKHGPGHVIWVCTSMPLSQQP